MKRICLAVLALSLVASAAAAQSLAELAKQEAARRKAIKTPAKVITDADLKRVVPAASPPPSTAPAAAGGSPGTAAPAAESVAAPPPVAAEAKEAQAAGEDEAQKDEAWWRKRITTARAALDHTKFLYDAMQTRINSLTADWIARDDPAQKAILERDRIRALAELQSLQEEIDKQTKAITDIEEEARRAGVPPGWLR
jgi:hypothetical protein